MSSSQYAKKIYSAMYIFSYKKRRVLTESSRMSRLRWDQNSPVDGAKME